MLDTENMQIVSRLLALTLERWCSHRAAKTKQSIAAVEACPKVEELQGLLPLCASATNNLDYIIFHRPKPLKSGR